LGRLFDAATQGQKQGNSAKNLISVGLEHWRLLMTRGLYLSKARAEILAEFISWKTGLTTDITEYEEMNNWIYVTVHNLEGYFVDTVNTLEEAEELVKAYPKEYSEDA